jgi:hypothetical protein
MMIIHCKDEEDLKRMEALLRQAGRNLQIKSCPADLTIEMAKKHLEVAVSPALQLVDGTCA